MLKKQGEREFFFAICELGSSDLVGQCGFHDVHPGVKADVGILLQREHLGRGLGTDAMNALVDYGFGELGFARIGLLVSPDNERAIRSYEKCGFTREGVLRWSRRRRGSFMDDLVMSVLRAEWEAFERPRSWELASPSGTAVRPPAGSGRAARETSDETRLKSRRFPVARRCGAAARREPAETRA